MGRQLHFYINQNIEDSIFDICNAIGLNLYKDSNQLDKAELARTDTSFIALGFSIPANSSAWNDADYIEYKGFSKKDLGFNTGRFWFDKTVWNPGTKQLKLKNPEITESYEKLIKSFKKEANFDKKSGLWVNKDFQEEYETNYEKHLTKLKELAEKNIEYAQTVLGARIVEE